MLKFLISWFLVGFIFWIITGIKAYYGKGYSKKYSFKYCLECILMGYIVPLIILHQILKNEEGE